MVDNSKPPLDLFAVIACTLGMFLMVLPVEADIVFGLYANRQFALAATFAVCCFLSVLGPALISFRRHYSSPCQWRGIGYLRGAVAILVFNLLMTASLLINAIA